MKRVPAIDPWPMPPLTAEEETYFWSWVDHSLDTERCWNWKGESYQSGYALVILRRKRYVAHRVSYWITFNVQPGKLLVMHECDNTSCCNPGHLKLGTAKDNIQDMIHKGRAFWQRTTA